MYIFLHAAEGALRMLVSLCLTLQVWWFLCLPFRRLPSLRFIVGNVIHAALRHCSRTITCDAIRYFVLLLRRLFIFDLL